MSIFSKDTLVADGGPKVSTTLQQDGCSTSSQYDPVVLQTLYGVGKITRSEYQRVKTGALSIDALNLAPAELSRLRLQDSAVSTYMDEWLERTQLRSAQFTGQGPSVVELDFIPSVLQPSVTGLKLDAEGLPKNFEVTASFDQATKKLSVSADASVHWSVLALYQKGAA